jgi:hypothetical protein
MISVDLKDNSVLISVNGKHPKVMTEMFITIVKLTGDNPESINVIKNFLKSLENDFKNGSDAEAIIKDLIMSYNDVFNVRNNK